MESEDFFLSCLKMFQLMEIEKLLLRMSLFTEGLKGSLHISEGHNVLYLGLHKREKTELMLWSHRLFFLKGHASHQPSPGET